MGEINEVVPCKSRFDRLCLVLVAGSRISGWFGGGHECIPCKRCLDRLYSLLQEVELENRLKRRENWINVDSRMTGKN